MFKPQAIYYEKEIENYQLGKELLEKYKEVPKILIENHNNIEEMRKKNNSEFPKIKQNHHPSQNRRCRGRARARRSARTA